MGSRTKWGAGALGRGQGCVRAEGQREKLACEGKEAVDRDAWRAAVHGVTKNRT